MSETYQTKRGRKTSRKVGPPVLIHFPPELVQTMDLLAAQLKISRGELVRRSCEFALAKGGVVERVKELV
jgi:hypothetical protein